MTLTSDCLQDTQGKGNKKKAAGGWHRGFSIQTKQIKIIYAVQGMLLYYNKKNSNYIKTLSLKIKFLKNTLLPLYLEYLCWWKAPTLLLLICNLFLQILVKKIVHQVLHFISKVGHTSAYFTYQCSIHSKVPTTFKQF